MGIITLEPIWTVTLVGGAEVQTEPDRTACKCLAFLEEWHIPVWHVYKNITGKRAHLYVFKCQFQPKSSLFFFFFFTKEPWETCELRLNPVLLHLSRRIRAKYMFKHGQNEKEEKRCALDFRHNRIETDRQLMMQILMLAETDESGKLWEFVCPASAKKKRKRKRTWWEHKRPTRDSVDLKLGTQQVCFKPLESGRHGDNGLVSGVVKQGEVHLAGGRLYINALWWLQPCGNPHSQFLK